MENDLQLRGSYESSPPCITLSHIPIMKVCGCMISLCGCTSRTSRTFLQFLPTSHTPNSFQYHTHRHKSDTDAPPIREVILFLYASPVHKSSRASVLLNLWEKSFSFSIQVLYTQIKSHICITQFVVWLCLCACVLCVCVCVCMLWLIGVCIYIWGGYD